jgi:hypothetical protein
MKIAPLNLQYLFTDIRERERERERKLIIINLYYSDNGWNQKQYIVDGTLVHEKTPINKTSSKSFITYARNCEFVTSWT